MPNILFIIIIFLLCAGYLFDLFLDYLNIKKLSNNIPVEFSDILDRDKYAKTINYERTGFWFGFVKSSFDFILILLVLFAGIFPLIDEWVRTLVNNPTLQTLSFFGIIALISGILSLPFQLYHTFVIEEKFGLNKTRPLTFFLDIVKSIFLSAILGGGILWLILWFYHTSGQWFWFYSWLIVSAFSIFMAFFYSNLIVPLFNKQTPLEEGELKTAINNFCIEAGFQLDNIFIIDGSKRSTRANAYFTGFGKKKRIVLYDTLINEMTINEIVAVLAHEIGHYKKNHVIKGLISGLIQTGFFLYIFSLFISRPELSQAIGAQTSFHIGAIVFGILFSPISLITGIVTNIFSRKNEFQADEFASGFGLGNSLIQGLKKLSLNNLSNLNPHPLYVFFHYSHPPVLQRINKIKSSSVQKK